MSKNSKRSRETVPDNSPSSDLAKKRKSNDETPEVLEGVYIFLLSKKK